MKLIYNLLNKEINLDENINNILVIEHNILFYKFIRNLIIGEYNEIILLDEKNEKLNVEKNVLLINDFFNLKINETSNITKLHNHLSRLIDQDELDSLNNHILKILANIEMLSMFDLSYDMNINITSFFKSINLSFDDDSNSTTLLEKLIYYIKIKASLQNFKVFFLVNATLYFDENDLEQIFKYASYSKIIIMLIECRLNFNIKNTVVHIIDEDICSFN